MLSIFAPLCLSALAAPQDLGPVVPEAISAEEAKAKPPLIPWQRTLADALALVEVTQKPLLICVNIEGEMASERLAGFQYRDPEFAALASGFVPVLVSPDRRNPRDHDGHGRRIVDTKFGRLVHDEHITMDTQVYDAYFGGRRIAPRPDRD